MKVGEYPHVSGTRRDIFTAQVVNSNELHDLLIIRLRPERATTGKTLGKLGRLFGLWQTE